MLSRLVEGEIEREGSRWEERQGVEEEDNDPTRPPCCDEKRKRGRERGRGDFVRWLMSILRLLLLLLLLILDSTNTIQLSPSLSLSSYHTSGGHLMRYSPLRDSVITTAHDSW